MEVVAMEAYEYFKQKREQTGMTVREFCKKVNISVGSCVEYQNGTKSLLSLPLDKTIRIFSVINIHIEKFYDDYFPELKEEITKRMIVWEEKRKPELDLMKLQHRYRARIAKMKERKVLPDVEIEQFLQEYKTLFKGLKAEMDSSGNISKTLYKERILPFSCRLKKQIENGEIKNSVSRRINDAMLAKEITYVELAHIVDITPVSLTYAKTSQTGYSSMKIGTVLKICYALDISFDEICELLLKNI